MICGDLNLLMSLTSHKARADRGVSSAGLSTTVQPAAMAAPALRVIIALGKFHCKIDRESPGNHHPH